MKSMAVTELAAPPASAASVSPWRRDFPALDDAIGGSVAYLDSAAMTLRPRAVIDAVTAAYQTLPANVHRGSYTWAEQTTAAFERARQRVAAHLNAVKQEIVLTRSCTEAINIVASGLGLRSSDQVLVSILEHHSNYLPWRHVAGVREIGLAPDGTLDLDQLEDAIDDRTVAIAITCASNVTGVIQPVAQIADIARRRGLVTILDAAQAVAHIPVDVEELGCDFIAFSGYKMFGPSGVGILWGRQDMLRRLGLWQTGGGMVDRVGDEITYLDGARRLEAGTPNIEGVLGLEAAIDYAVNADRDAMCEHTRRLYQHCRRRLQAVDDLLEPLLPSDAPSIPILTLRPRVGRVGAQRLAAILSDSYGVAVRDGVHCCQPLFRHVGAQESIRISLQCYNTSADVDRLVDALEDMRPLME
jgi:cysteine desulfurase / selenocysteine lyase